MEPKMLAIDVANGLGLTPQAIHNQLKRKDLPFEKSRNRVYFGHTTSRKLLNIRFHPKIIAFQIVKGGTGKTTTCHSVAVRAALYGARVLCIDLDQQANLTTAFRVNAENTPVMIELIQRAGTERAGTIQDGIVNVIDGLDLFPSRIENALLDNVIMLNRLPLDRIYRDILSPIKDSYDFIFIDCPPALGSSVTAATLASDIVVSPVTPARFDLSGLKITSHELNNIEGRFGKKVIHKILLNEFDGRKSLSHEVLHHLVRDQEYGSKLFKTAVRVSQEFTNVTMHGTSIFDSFKHSTAKEDIDLLTREMLGLDEAKEDRIEISNTKTPVKEDSLAQLSA